MAVIIDYANVIVGILQKLIYASLEESKVVDV